MSAHGTLERADRAAWDTRRLLDASRCILTGNLALACCLPALLMVWWEVAGSDLSRLLGAVLMLGFMAWVLVSLRLVVQLRSTQGVKVVDRLETNLIEIKKHPFKRLVPSYALVIGSGLLWSYLFKVMPNAGILVVMWSTTAMMTGMFVGRFYVFRFWEDLLFAGSVALAWSMYLLRARELAPFVVLAPLGVVLGTVFLYLRWRHWLESLRSSNAATAAAEGCP